VPTGFLSDAERARLDSFPAQVLPGDIETRFTLPRADRRQIPRTASPANRLGAALQLGALGFLGFYPDDLSSAPVTVVAFVARQVDVAPGEPWIERYPPQANSRDAERWEGVIMDTLAEGVLWDANYDMGDEFLDDDPDSADAKRRLLAIDEDYFAAPPPDATDAELAEIRRKLAKLCGRPPAE